MILWIFLLFIFEQKICSLLFNIKICKWNQSFQKSFVTNLTFMNERSLMTSKSTLLKWMKCIIVLGYVDYRHIGLHQSLLYNYSEQYTFNISRSRLQISNRKKYENFDKYKQLKLHNDEKLQAWSQTWTWAGPQSMV